MNDDKNMRKNMKKILLSLIVAFFAIITAQALCINRTFYAYDDGKYYGKLELKSDGNFTISTVDGEKFSGTYYINADELEKGSQYQIDFNLSDGRTIKTQYMWPLRGKQCVDLDGFLFEAQ